VEGPDRNDGRQHVGFSPDRRPGANRDQIARYLDVGGTLTLAKGILSIAVLGVWLAPPEVSLSVASLKAAQVPRAPFVAPVTPDHSLSPATYIQKGLPAYDRDWAPQDYSDAARVMQSLAASDVTQLPRYGSPRSGIVFARLVSSANIGFFLTDTTTTDQDRAMALLQVLQNVNRITTIYAGASTTRQQLLDSELIELMRFSLEVSRSVVRLSDRRSTSLAPTDATLKAIGQVRQGFASVVSGCLGEFTEQQRGLYRTSELVRLAQFLETFLPASMSLLPTATQQEIPVRIQRLLLQERDATLKDYFGHIAVGLELGKNR
jgi:hypothetical protein